MGKLRRRKLINDDKRQILIIPCYIVRDVLNKKVVEKNGTRGMTDERGITELNDISAVSENKGTQKSEESGAVN